MNINPGQFTVLTATPLDSNGNPTKLPVGDVPGWSVDNPNVVKVTPSTDGLQLSVTVNTDAPAGDITFALTDSLNAAATGAFVLTVSGPAPAPVASFGITASTPV